MKTLKNLIILLLIFIAGLGVYSIWTMFPKFSWNNIAIWIAEIFATAIILSISFWLLVYINTYKK